jgi:hypothetical protein
MRAISAGASFVLVLSAVTSLGAALQGSESLQSMTLDVISSCPGSVGMTYDPTGNDLAEASMSAGVLGVAPMTRQLHGLAGCASIGGVSAGDHACGMVVALDALVVTAGTSPSGGCGGVAFDGRFFTVTERNGVPGLQCPGCDPANNYAAADFADYLRLLFFGIHHDAAATRDCNSDARRSLVASYPNLFQSTSCLGGSCGSGPIHRVFRPRDGDRVETFLRLLGVPSSYRIATLLPSVAQQSNPFCNAPPVVPPGQNFRVVTGFADFLDEDPIRVPCTGTGAAPGEQVCGSAVPSGFTPAIKRLGTLGLVLPILVPDPANVPPPEIYATSLCTAGQVELLPCTKSTCTGNACPAGNPAFGGKCFSSVLATSPTTFDANCIQRFGTGFCPFLVPAGTDCRGANLWVRAPNGDLRKDTTVLGAPARQILGAFYRLHSTQPQPGGLAPCAAASPFDQVVCLTGNADPCSVGVTSRTAAVPGPSAPQDLHGLAPSVPNIQTLITSPSPSTTYPLSHKLYLNTILGFPPHGLLPPGPELSLAGCYADPALMAPIVPAHGFVPTPAGVVLEDFDEVAECGAPSNVVACP